MSQFGIESDLACSDAVPAMPPNRSNTPLLDVQNDAPAPATEQATPSIKGIDRRQAKVLAVLSVASYLFWLGHSYAVREAFAAVRYLAGYWSRH